MIKINYERAIRTLEFDKITELLADCAPTDGARELCLRLRPDYDFNRITKRLSQTTDAKQMSLVKGMPPFEKISDSSVMLGRAEKGASLNARELLNIASTLRNARRLINYYNTDRRDTAEETPLHELFSRLETEKGLEDKINRTIIAEDMIADEASPELADIRRKIRAANNRIKDDLQKFISTPSKSKQLPCGLTTLKSGILITASAPCGVVSSEI